MTSLLNRRPPADTRPQGATGSWFRITNKAAPVADVFVYDEIGLFGVSAQAFADELRQVTASQINLHINSPGGEVFDGMAIYNTLRKHPAKVTTFVDGLAASAASFIACAGDRIVIARHGTMMIHDASGLCMGNGRDMRSLADLLDKLSDNIADIYVQKAGGTVADWRDRMRAETWFSAKEAVAAGLADEMADADPEPVADVPRNDWDRSMFAIGRELVAKATAQIEALVPTPAEIIAVDAQPAPEANFNPAQKRDDHGKWSDGNPLPSLRSDKLKLAGKIDLEPGETLVGSAKFDGDSGGARVALTMLDGRPSWRVGFGGEGFGRADRDEGVAAWDGNPTRTPLPEADRQRLDAEHEALGEEYDSASAERQGEIDEQMKDIREQLGAGDDDFNGTARLDEYSMERLSSVVAPAIAEAVEQLARENAAWDELEAGGADAARTAELRRIARTDPDAPGYGGVTFAEGILPGSAWGDVHYRVELDDPDVGPYVSIGVTPKDAPDDWGSDRDWQGRFDPTEWTKFQRQVEKLRAAADPNAGGQEDAVKNKFHPDQKRDDHGRWTDGLPGGSLADALHSVDVGDNMDVTIGDDGKIRVGWGDEDAGDRTVHGEMSPSQATVLAGLIELALTVDPDKPTTSADENYAAQIKPEGPADWFVGVDRVGDIHLRGPGDSDDQTIEMGSDDAADLVDGLREMAEWHGSNVVTETADLGDLRLDVYGDHLTLTDDSVEIDIDADDIEEWVDGLTDLRDQEYDRTDTANAEQVEAYRLGGSNVELYSDGTVVVDGEFEVDLERLLKVLTAIHEGEDLPQDEDTAMTNAARAVGFRSLAEARRMIAHKRARITAGDGWRKQRRDRKGRWSDGMPDVVMSEKVHLARGGHIELSSPQSRGGKKGKKIPPGTVRMSDGTSHVDLTEDEATRLNYNVKKLLAGMENGQTEPYRRASDGTTLFEVTREDEGIFRLKIPGSTHAQPGTPDEAGQQMVTWDLSNVAHIADAVSSSRRVDTDTGPVDLFPTDDSRIGLRVGRGGGNDPAEVSFSEGEWKEIRRALDVVGEGFDETSEEAGGEFEPSDVTHQAVPTSAGRIVITRDGAAGSGLLSISSPKDGWSITWPQGNDHPMSEAFDRVETFNRWDIYNAAPDWRSLTAALLPLTPSTTNDPWAGLVAALTPTPAPSTVDDALARLREATQ